MSRPQITSILPGFSVLNLAQSIEFYTAQLGFEVIFRNGELFAIVARDGAEISLGLDRTGQRAGGGSCYLKMEGIDALYEELVGQGVAPTQPLRTESYQMREFQITDPDGNIINFGQPTAPAKRLAPPLP